MSQTSVSEPPIMARAVGVLDTTEEHIEPQQLNVSIASSSFTQSTVT